MGKETEFYIDGLIIKGESNYQSYLMDKYFEGDIEVTELISIVVDSESENINLMDIMVKIRDTFDERDELAEGHGMDDAVACPVAVAQYGLNKLLRLIDENKRLTKELGEK